MVVKRASLAGVLVLALAVPLATSAAIVPPPPGITVIALIDDGINPYNIAFRDRSALAQQHPSTYIPGYPRNAIALRLTLDVPYDVAMRRDAKVWASIKPKTLYWIPGTKIVGAITFGAGGTNCPVVPIPPANALNRTACVEHPILDDYGHGTMTASRAAGTPHSLAPSARIVEIEGLGADSLNWASSRGWIDVNSNSWVDLVPPPVNSVAPESLFGPSVSIAFENAVHRMFVLAASGNGTAFSQGLAPTPTYLLSTAPPGVVLVGGHDNGKWTLWAGAPPHVVADAYAGWAAISTSSTAIRPDPIACCTSAAAPYAAGGAAAIIREARILLHATGTGVHGGVIARGRAGLVKHGPLADGVFTLDELRQVFMETAEARPALGRDDGNIHWAGDPRAPEPMPYGIGSNPFCQLCTTTPVGWTQIPADAPAYPLIGYGAINERSLAFAVNVLRGRAPMPVRPQEDMAYDVDQALRMAIFREARTG